MISDEVLRTALIASFEERMALCEREIEENPHRFSLAYKIRKRSIIRLARRYEETKETSAERHFMPLRRLALIIAIIAAAVILSVGAYAAYLIINGFVFDRHETYSGVTLDLSEYDLEDSITEIYMFAPKNGIECVSKIVENEIVISKYQLNGKSILLTQYSKDSIESGFLSANTEESKIHEVTVNGNDGFTVIRYRESEDEFSIAAWIKNGYVFSVSSKEFTDNELIELADWLIIENDIN